MKLFCSSDVLKSRHYPHVSAVVFTMLCFTVLGMGFPMLLMAQEIQQTSSSQPMLSPLPPLPPSGALPVGSVPSMNSSTPTPSPAPAPMPAQGAPTNNFNGQPPSFGGGGQGGPMMGPPHQGENNFNGPQGGFGGGNFPNGGMMQGGPGNGPEGMNQEQNDQQQQQMEKMQQEQDARQKEMEKRQLAQMKRGLRGMQQGIASFDKKIAQLGKQGISVPADCADNLNKVKSVISALQSAQTLDEAQSAGIEDMGDLMQSLNDCRQNLDMLSHWPQTLKQADRMLAQFAKQLKRDKAIADRLSAQGIDVSAEYSAFESAVNNLKAVRDGADAKMKSGDAEGAFGDMQDSFFGQMQDMGDQDRIIQTMSHLGRFASDYKRGIAEAQRTINTLKRHKLDTSTLEDLLNQSKATGDEVLSLLKTKPIDTDTVLSDIQGLEDLRQQFGSAADDLSGSSSSATAMPWQQQGPQDLRPIQAPDFSQFNSQQSPQQPSGQ